MAMFQNPKYQQLEEKYLNNNEYQVGQHTFTLTLLKIVPDAKNILHYDWKVTLSDGYHFFAPMGAQTISYPSTRLGIIIEELQKANIYQKDYLANAINDKIDEVFREYNF